MIDFRSDTVTQPSAGMREAMANAPVGDDVFGDDPTVNALEQRVADLLGLPAAVLCASGTQSNLMALLSHCQRGEEYLVGEEYHTYRYEAGGAAVLGGIVPQTVPVADAGELALDSLEQRIKPDDPHFPVTRLLALENTHKGQVIPQSFMHQARQLTARYGLQLHLDGARLWNAAVDCGEPLTSLCEPFDSVSVCFSKGLGTPVGSVLAGSEQLIRRARRWRKMLGGGMRQAGVLAAAMNYALDHQVHRLAADHAHARQLATGLQAMPGLNVTKVATNMVYVSLADAEQAASWQQFMARQGIRLPTGRHKRLVTHLDITAADIEDFLALTQDWAGQEV